MIRKITKLDLNYARDLIRKYHFDSLSFEFCNGYISQATRNYPRIYYFDKETIVFFTKKTQSKNSPFVIVSSIGEERINAIKSLAKLLYNESKKEVIIKNVDDEFKKLLKEKGFRNYREEKWDDFSKYDDNTFPQIVLNVKELIDLEGSAFIRLREEFSLFDRKFRLDIKEYHEKDKNIFLNLLNEWASQMHERSGFKQNKKEIIRATKLFEDFRDDFLQYLVYDKRNKKYIGFISFSAISPTTLGYNALVNDFNYFGSYRRLIYEGLKLRLGKVLII